MIKIIIAVIVLLFIIYFFKEHTKGAVILTILSILTYFIIKYKAFLKKLLYDIWDGIISFLNNIRNGDFSSLKYVWKFISPILSFLIKILVIIVIVSIIIKIIKFVVGCFLKAAERKIKKAAYDLLCVLGTASREEYIYLNQFYFYKYLNASMIDKYGNKDVNNYTDNPHNIEELENELNCQMVNENLSKCSEEYKKYSSFFDDVFKEYGVKLISINHTVLYDTGHNGVMSMESYEIIM